jgi:plastocyanin
VAALVAAGMLVLAGGACSAADDPEPDVADLSFEPVATLSVDESGFDVDQLDITAGDTITLVNAGDEPHSFTSTDPLRDTGELLPGEEVLMRFDEAGEVQAHDGTDPDAEVTIVVAERPDED